MKQITHILIFTIFMHSAFAQTPSGATVKWDRIFGSNGDDFAGSVCGDGTGGYVLAGTTNYSGGMLPAYYGVNDIVVVHYDANGDIVWTKVYGSIGPEGVSCIVKLDDGYALVGSTTSGLTFLSGGTLKSSFKGGISDMLVMKIDNAGNTIWYGHYGGVKEDIATVCINNGDGSLLVGGYSKSGSGDFFGMNHGSYDMALLRIDLASGLVTAADQIGGTMEEQVIAMQKGAGSDIIVTGYTFSEDGDLASTTPHGDADVLVATMPATLTGATHIMRTGGSYQDYPTDVIYTGSGYIVSGYTLSEDFGGMPVGSADVFLSCLSNDLTMSAPVLLGGDSDEITAKLAYRNSGGRESILMCSYSYSSSANGSVSHGEADVLLMELNYPSLEVNYSKFIGSTAEDRAVGLFVNAPADNSFIIYGSTAATPIAGSANGDVSFHRTSATTADIPFEDFWILRMEDLHTYYADADGDGYGSASAAISSALPIAPEGYTIDKTDCNDASAAIHPAAAEICNAMDDNCNGLSDDADPSVTGQETWYADADMDGFGNAAINTAACIQPAGYTDNLTDCSDDDAGINPSAAELCNAVDDNCNGTADEGLSMNTFYADADNDGYGNAAVFISTCAASQAGYVLNNTDCNDATAAISPVAAEACNTIDDNCNGITDDVVNAVLSPVDGAFVCKGNSATLSATTGTGYSYNWTRDGVAFAAHTANITTPKAGLYSVSITSADGCTAVSNAVNLVVNPNPKATIITVSSADMCVLGFTALKAKIYPGSTYQWYKNGVELPGFTSNAYSFNTAGAYQFLETNAAGCSKMSAIVDVYSSCRIAEVNMADVYPNPSDGNFMLHATMRLTTSEVLLEIKDITGKIVYSRILPAAEEINEEVHLDASVANGMYILTLHSDTQDHVKRIMISK